MKLAISHVPPVASRALKSGDFSYAQDQQLSARAALGVWAAMAAVGWAALLGAAALIF